MIKGKSHVSNKTEMKGEPSAHVAANVKLSSSKKEKVCSTRVGEKS